MEINNPADTVKYLKNNWSGEYGGPLAAVEALVDNSGYFEHIGTVMKKCISS